MYYTDDLDNLKSSAYHACFYIYKQPGESERINDLRFFVLT